jgi:hypothetical protein
MPEIYARARDLALASLTTARHLRRMTRPELEITFRARGDGDVVMECVRADGTRTWQRQKGPRAAFFPFHDLTHYAVETVLGAREGFYGLIAAGWDIDDTGGKGARGPLPPEAALVEHLVGLFDLERMGGAEPLTAESLVVALAPRTGPGALPPLPPLRDAQLQRVRDERDRLHDAWARTAPGETLSVAFTRPARSGLSSD